MRVKRLLFIESAIWVATSIALAGIFYFWDPFRISPAKESFFYLVLIINLGFFFTLAISGTLRLLRKFSGGHINLALRQGFLYAILIAFVLFLQSRRLFSWWNFSLFVLALALIEMLSYFSKYERTG